MNHFFLSSACGLLQEFCSFVIIFLIVFLFFPASSFFSPSSYSSLSVFFFFLFFFFFFVFFFFVVFFFFFFFFVFFFFFFFLFFLLLLLLIAFSFFCKKNPRDLLGAAFFLRDFSYTSWLISPSFSNLRNPRRFSLYPVHVLNVYTFLSNFSEHWKSPTLTY